MTVDNYIWDESPYKDKSVKEVIDDYVLVRGDLSEQYARDQLTSIVEHRIDTAYDNGKWEVTEALKELHYPVQYVGWRKWVQMFLRNPRAYVPKWCRECEIPWPCATADAIFEGQSEADRG